MQRVRCNCDCEPVSLVRRVNNMLYGRVLYVGWCLFTRMVNMYSIDDVVDVVRYFLERDLGVDVGGVVKAMFNRPVVRVVDSSSLVRVYMVSANFDQPNMSKFEDRYYSLSVDIRSWSLSIVQAVVDDVLGVLDDIKSDPNPDNERKYDTLEVLGIDDLTEGDRNEHHNVIELIVSELNVYVGTD